MRSEVINQKKISKIRFIEPGNLPYRPSIKNLYTYDKYIRTPSTGLLTLTTIVKDVIEDTVMYSESISKIRWKDVLDSDIVFIGIFTFNAKRGYEIAQYIKKRSNAIVVMGGLHASLHYIEAIEYCDYVLLSEADESILEFINLLRSNKKIDLQGIAYKSKKAIIFTGYRKSPENINTIPNRNLLYRYHKMVRYNTLWLQVHASRGCPHDCDYCAIIQHFGRKVRTRTPDNIIEDIKQCIKFHKRKIIPRINKVLWITDDNFFADRIWAKSVLEAIIKSGIKYNFTIQARFEVGFDDEMLSLLKNAGFLEIAMGIEFLEDEAFDNYNKKCTYQKLIDSIQNIQKHGIGVRGLFIVGADNHTIGIGQKIVEFVFKYNITGILLQAMYFIPGTPVYEKYKDRLIHQDWSKYDGNVVHFPENITPWELQKEIIYSLKKIYNLKRIRITLFNNTKTISKILFIGEYFWQRSVCKKLEKELPLLKFAAPSPGDSSAIVSEPLTN